MDFALTAAAGITPSQISLIVIIAALSVLMLIVTRRRVRESRNSPRAYAREQVVRLREERQVQHEVREVMLEMERLSREMNAQIDTRFAKLESAIRSADERIDTLTRLLHAADGNPAIDVTVGEEAEPPPTPGDEMDRIRNHVCALADAGRAPADIAREVGRTAGEVELILALHHRTTAKLS